METTPKCCKCGETRLLKRCNNCKSIFCVHCAAPIINPETTQTETLISCLNCHSDNVVDVENTFLKK